MTSRAKGHHRIISGSKETLLIAVKLCRMDVLLTRAFDISKSLQHTNFYG